MKKIIFISILLVMCNTMLCLSIPNRNIKVYGYLVAWALKMNMGSSNYENCLYTNIDYDACTDYIMFNTAFDSVGGMHMVDDWYYGDNTAWHQPYFQVPKRRLLNDYIHSKGKAIHLCFYCGGSEWTTLVNSQTHRNAMIKTIVDSVIGPTNRYDGVHFDLEPMSSEVIASDSAGLRAFFSALYDTLQKYHQWVDTTKKPELTITLLGSQGTYFFPSLNAYIDAYLHMTYNLMGSWQSISWYNCPIYKTGYESAQYNVQSLHDYTQLWLSAGIPPDKLVMACPFNYNIFKGGLTPTGEGCYAPLLTMVVYPTWMLLNARGELVNGYAGNEMYYSLWNKYLDTASSATVHYDSIRKAAWWGYNSTGNENDMIAIFQDTTCVREILQYISNQGLRGAMIWEICGAYINDLNQGRHPGLTSDHLLQAAKATRLNLLNSTSVLDLPKSDNNILSSVDGSISLFQNYPNPFNSYTRIPYYVSKKSRVRLRIFNILGQLITTLVDQEKDAGYHEVIFDTRQRNYAASLTTGIYFYQVETNGSKITKMLIVMK